VAASCINFEKVGVRLRGFRVRRRGVEAREEADFFMDRGELALGDELESDEEDDL
jgi:hypothetical protein